MPLTKQDLQYLPKVYTWKYFIYFYVFIGPFHLFLGVSCNVYRSPQTSSTTFVENFFLGNCVLYLFLSKHMAFAESFPKRLSWNILAFHWPVIFKPQVLQMPKHQLSVVLENSAHCFRSHRITGQLHTLRIKPLFKNVIYRLFNCNDSKLWTTYAKVMRFLSRFPSLSSTWKASVWEIHRIGKY